MRALNSLLCIRCHPSRRPDVHSRPDRRSTELLRAHFETDEDANVSLKWTSVPGYRDILESTTDLFTWNPLTPPLCGYGQTWSMSVPDARSTPGTGGGTYMPVYVYSQRRYADDTLLLTWTSGDIPWRKKFDPHSDWAEIAWPGAFSYVKTNPNGIVAPYRVLVFTFSAHPNASATSFTSSDPLTTDVNERLHRLTDIPTTVIADYIASLPPPAGPEDLGSASSGQHALYRVRREILDTDDDLLNDCEEMTWGFTDETNADTDNDTTLDTGEDFDTDGSTNLEELACATNLVSGGSLHNPAATFYYDSLNVFSGRIDFRCWQDIRKPYRYRMEQSADLLDWTEVNPYNRIQSQFAQSGPVPGMDILSARSDYLGNGLPHPFMRVKVSRAFPPHHLKHPTAPVRRHDWKAHNNAHIDALIPANEFGRNVFDRYTPDGDCQWARWCWTNQLDFSGICFSNGAPWPPGLETLNTGGPPHVIRVERTGTTATITTDRPHQTAVGRSVDIVLTKIPSVEQPATGILPPALAPVHGTWTVTATPNGETFTCTTDTSGTIAPANTDGVMIDSANPTWPYYKWSCNADIVMLTPVHGVFSNHIGNVWLEGSVAVFHDRDGKRITRTIVKRHPTTPAEFTSADMGVVKLNAPLPEGVKIYKLFDPSHFALSPLADIVGTKLLFFTREMELFPRQISYRNFLDIYTVTPPGTPLFYQLPPRLNTPDQTYAYGAGAFGDSSGAMFVFYKGEMIYWGQVPGICYAEPYVQGYLQQIINTKLDGGYTLQTITLDP